ncbi:hypothetical protein T03_13452 [Trichinella britovi]|uniref:Uncharacterized protein n=1 Tax=Trichinella britovi TaxID=45882 RepID=A0A0V1CWL7_TRIBR|nr:hypothetical protein T03_13452 [Trichinella britovi]
MGLLQWARSAIVPIDGRDALLALILKAKKKQQLMKDIKQSRCSVGRQLGVGGKVGKSQNRIEEQNIISTQHRHFNRPDFRPNENFTSTASKLGLLLLKLVTKKRKDTSEQQITTTSADHRYWSYDDIASDLSVKQQLTTAVLSCLAAVVFA